MRTNGLIAAALLILGGVAIFVTNTPESDPAAPTGAQTASIANGMGGPAEMPLPEIPVDMQGPDGFTAADSTVPGDEDLVIGRKQTFYEAMQAHGVGHTDIMALVKAVKPFRNLKSVHAGEHFRVATDADGQLTSFGFDLDLESWIRYVRTGNTFEQEQGSYPVEHRVCGVSGTIASSLYASLQGVSAPLDLAPKMTDVLGWDVDFQRDVRKGDTFRILYEEVWKNGTFVRTGPILACAYGRSDRTLSAYRYLTGDGNPGYYDTDGKNLQKALMRAPLNYSRISSGFSYARRHPVLGRVMPHLGIDYAAPIGTPVWAAGNGTIIDIGRKGGNGRYIRIQHTNREYETYYLHLSRFAKNMHRGTHVHQGQVIGYVGASGYATGPHLDFRVKRGGTFVNPRKLKLPAAEPVPGDERAVFDSQRDLYQWALADLPDTTSPETLTALSPSTPPHWNAEAYVAASIPAAVRAVAED